MAWSTTHDTSPEKRGTDSRIWHRYAHTTGSGAERSFHGRRNAIPWPSALYPRLVRVCGTNPPSRRSSWSMLPFLS